MMSKTAVCQVSKNGEETASDHLSNPYEIDLLLIGFAYFAV